MGILNCIVAIILSCIRVFQVGISSQKLLKNKTIHKVVFAFSILLESSSFVLFKYWCCLIWQFTLLLFISSFIFSVVVPPQTTFNSFLIFVWPLFLGEKINLNHYFCYLYPVVRDARRGVRFHHFRPLFIWKMGFTMHLFFFIPVKWVTKN